MREVRDQITVTTLVEIGRGVSEKTKADLEIVTRTESSFSAETSSCVTESKETPASAVDVVSRESSIVSGRTPSLIETKSEVSQHPTSPNVNGVRVVGAPAAVRQTWLSSIGGAEGAHRLGLSTQEVKRQEVIFELLVTEKDYIEDLQTLVDVFIRPMREKQILKPKDISAIFSNIEQLVPMHQELYQSLESRTKEGEVVQEVGDIFLRILDYLKVYTLYCANHQSALTVLKGLSQQKEVKRFTQNAILLPQCKRQTLSSYLLKPVQRICKYPLLLKEILKNTPEGHPDKENVSKALHKIESIVNIVNEGARQAETTHKLISLQNRLTPKMTVISNNRKLLKTGLLEVMTKETRLSSTAERRGKRRHIFLFNDMVIIAKELEDRTPDGEYKLKVLGTAPLDAVVVEDLPDEPSCSNMFKITTEPNTKFIFISQTNEIKQAWLASFRNITLEHVEEYRKRVSSNGSSPTDGHNQNGIVTLSHSRIVSASSESMAKLEDIRLDNNVSTMECVATTVAALQDIVDSSIASAPKIISQSEENHSPTEPIPFALPSTNAPGATISKANSWFGKSFFKPGISSRQTSSVGEVLKVNPFIVQDRNDIDQEKDQTGLFDTMRSRSKSFTGVLKRAFSNSTNNINEAKLSTNTASPDNEKGSSELNADAKASPPVLRRRSSLSSLAAETINSAVRTLRRRSSSIANVTKSATSDTNGQVVSSTPAALLADVIQATSPVVDDSSNLKPNKSRKNSAEDTGYQIYNNPPRRTSVQVLLEVFEKKAQEAAAASRANAIPIQQANSDAMKSDHSNEVRYDTAPDQQVTHTSPTTTVLTGVPDEQHQTLPVPDATDRCALETDMSEMDMIDNYIGDMSENKVEADAATITSLHNRESSRSSTHHTSVDL